MSGKLDAFLRVQFPQDPCGDGLLAEAIACQEFDSSRAARLVAAARGEGANTWPYRSACCLLLERLLLCLAPGHTAAFRDCFGWIGIPLSDDLPVQISLFRARISRLRRVHDRFCGLETPPEALADFFHVARHDCKITVARYCFRPSEVLERIRNQIRESGGVADECHTGSLWYGEESERALRSLPAAEVAVLHDLAAARRVSWAGSLTGMEMNSLIEYPIGSAALVLKLPGSDVEVEIKRAGVRGEHPLTVISERNGLEVPLGHRLQGAGLGWFVRKEAESASVFASLFRIVHHSEAPISIPLWVFSQRTVPAAGGEVELVEYLSNPQVYGEGYEAMRKALIESLPAFRRHHLKPWESPLAGELGGTLEFLWQTDPLQIALCGTSAFRLDRVAMYLSPEGPEHYFTAGLQRSYTFEDSRRMAEEVLEEILGVYLSPAARIDDYPALLDAAFAEPANRALADRAFLNCMRQIGECFGTLLGLGGYSDGESFVVRNVGLKSAFADGEWKAKLIFMDHDELSIPGRRQDPFQPIRTTQAQRRDHHHIFGQMGEIALLKRIYRVDERVAAEGELLARNTTIMAKRKTRCQVLNTLELRANYTPRFLESLQHWDDVFSMYWRCGCAEEWRRKARPYLEKRRYDRRRLESFLSAAERFRGKREIAWLYETGPDPGTDA